MQYTSILPYVPQLNT